MVWPSRAILIRPPDGGSHRNAVEHRGAAAARGSQRQGVRTSRLADGSTCMDADEVPSRQGVFRPDQGRRDKTADPDEGVPSPNRQARVAAGGLRRPLEAGALRDDCGRVALQPWPGSRSSRRPCPTAARAPGSRSARASVRKASIFSSSGLAVSLGTGASEQGLDSQGVELTPPPVFGSRHSRGGRRPRRTSDTSPPITLSEGGAVASSRSDAATVHRRQACPVGFHLTSERPS